MSTFGALSVLQYVPGDSILHRLDPRSKYGFFAGYSIGLVSSHSLTASLFYTLVALFLIRLSKLRLVLLWENTRALLVLVILFNGFQIAINGIEAAAVLTLKTISLVWTVSLIGSTSSPEKQMEGLRILLSPLRRLGVKTETYAVMLSVAVIYLPLLMEDLMRILQAQRLRGSRHGRWNLAGRGRDRLSLLTPLLLTTFRRAERLSDAMESRCFMPGGERTSFYHLKFGRREMIAVILGLLLPLIHLSFFE